MVIQYLDYILGVMLPDFISLLDSLMLSSGVSWLDFCIAIILLVVVIGSILMRVS